MPKHVVATAGLIALCLASSLQAATPRAADARRDGYALPSDASAAAGDLPRAYAPARPGFYQSLDLPEAGDFQDEVLRFTASGVTPVLIVQFAVVRPGAPVQAMVERAPGLDYLKDARRSFGRAAWPEFERLKALAMPVLLQPPRDDPAAAGGGTVTAVDRVCWLEYAGLGLSVRRRIDCAGSGPSAVAAGAMIDEADADVRARR